MASLSDLFAGTPPTYGVNVVGGGKSPYYNQAGAFGNYLMSLLGQPLPSYGGQIDPGMSPTLSSLGQMLQAYSQSPLPSIMGQSSGVLGRFMNPSFANPVSRMQFGFPQYFGGGGMQNPFGHPMPWNNGPVAFDQGNRPMPIPPGFGPNSPWSPTGMQPPMGQVPFDQGSQPFPMSPSTIAPESPGQSGPYVTPAVNPNGMGGPTPTMTMPPAGGMQNISSPVWSSPTGIPTPPQPTAGTANKQVQMDSTYLPQGNPQFRALFGERNQTALLPRYNRGGMRSAAMPGIKRGKPRPQY